MIQAQLEAWFITKKKAIMGYKKTHGGYVDIFLNS